MKRKMRRRHQSLIDVEVLTFSMPFLAIISTAVKSAFLRSSCDHSTDETLVEFPPSSGVSWKSEKTGFMGQCATGAMIFASSDVVIALLATRTC